MSIKPPKGALAVLQQRWTVTLPTGVIYDAGSSYHLTLADRDAMAQGVADRLNTDLSGEHEEPIGDPVEIRVTADLYEQIKRSPLGLRVR